MRLQRQQCEQSFDYIHPGLNLGVSNAALQMRTACSTSRRAAIERRAHPPKQRLTRHRHGMSHKTTRRGCTRRANTRQARCIEVRREIGLVEKRHVLVAKLMELPSSFAVRSL